MLLQELTKRQMQLIDGVEGLADFNEILSAADSFSIVPEKEGFKMY